MIRLRNLERNYPLGHGKFFYVLRDIDIEVAEGEFVSVMGPSGAGKSTLLHILGMHDHGWTGEYFFNDTAVHHLKAKERATLRNENIGFVFQQYHLLDDLTVYENLEIPLSYRKVGKSERSAIVADALDRFQMVAKKDLYPRQLSGGQQQLVGVARAIIASPKLILADEPTTLFTVVNAIVLRGFSFPHPEQLVSVGLIDPKATDQNNNFGLGQIPTAQDYEDLKAAQRSFSLMAGYLNGSTINVSYKNNPQRYTGGYVTEDYFKIIGVSPVMGRDFTAADNKPGAEKVALLGDEIWRRDFGADPNIVGQAVRINGKAATIIGVMPPNFKFPSSEELWTPLYNEYPPRPRGDLI